MAEQAQQSLLFDGSQLSALIDQSSEVSEALSDLCNKCLYTDELVVVQLQTHANLDVYQDYFINSLDDSFDVVTVNAHLLMSTEELFREIIDQAELDVELSDIQNDPEKLLFVLGQAVDELKAESAELALQVNFAHELSSGVLNDLMSLIENLRNQGAFHAVLWMDLDSAMAFENRISALNLEFSVIEVLRFSAGDINEYLKFVFASNEQPFGLSRENVKQIITGSGGEATKIDQLASGFLEKNHRSSGKKKDEYLLLKSMVALAVTALVIMFILPDEGPEGESLNDEAQGQPERIVIGINTAESPEFTEEPVFTPPVVADLPATSDQLPVEESLEEPQGVVFETDPGLTDVASVEGNEVLPEAVEQDTPVTESEPEENMAIDEADTVSGPLVEVVDATTVSAPDQVEVIEELSPYEVQLQSLLSHADNEAFIQLLGTYDEGVAQGFIEDYEIDDSFYYARTDLNGRDWFVVLYGGFVSERAAINALGSLPANLQEGGPWVRNMRNIRATVK